MKVQKTALPEVLLIEPQLYVDERGYFFEVYHDRRYQEIGLPSRFVQDNYSRSRQGTLRGLHYQIRHPQGKIVQVTVGEVFDVAVDLRRFSPNFGKWVGVVLSSENRHQLWIPPGYAHGFYVLSEWAEVYYKVTDYYAPEWDRTLLWNDPQVGITWPLREGRLPLLSAKDAAGKRLAEADVFEE